MTKTIRLGSFLYTSPAAWHNFINDLTNRGVKQDDDEGFSLETLNSELEQFNARYYDEDRIGYVEFASEESYFAFLLTHGSINAEHE